MAQRAVKKKKRDVARKTVKKTVSKTRTQKQKTKKSASVPVMLTQAIERFEIVVSDLEGQEKNAILEKIFIGILKQRKEEIEARKSDNAGRYPFDATTHEQEYSILSKLSVAWEMGCSDREACLHAGISPQALVRYKQKYPEIKEYADLLREQPIFTARKAVVKELPKNPALSFRFLQSKLPAEFAIGRFAGEGGSDEVSKDGAESAKKAWQLIQDEQ